MVIRNCIILLKMVSCQQLRNKFSDLEATFVTKFPRLGRWGFYAALAIIVLILFILALVIGLGARKKTLGSPDPDNSSMVIR